MPRAGQTPHGARPNREESSGFGWDTCRPGASQPPGRSLEPRSNARPRGMTVPPRGGQNSAYRSGCHNLPVFKPFTSQKTNLRASWITRGGGAEGQDSAKLGAADIADRVISIRVIQNVEDICMKRYFLRFSERKPLGNGAVDVALPRSAQQISPDIAFVGSEITRAHHDARASITALISSHVAAFRENWRCSK
jgi:hypothetical protein